MLQTIYHQAARRADYPAQLLVGEGVKNNRAPVSLGLPNRLRRFMRALDVFHKGDGALLKVNALKLRQNAAPQGLGGQAGAVRNIKNGATHVRMITYTDAKKNFCRSQAPLGNASREALLRIRALFPIPNSLRRLRFAKRRLARRIPKRRLGTTGRRRLGTTGRRRLGTTGRWRLGTTGRRRLGTTGRRRLGTTGRRRLGTTGRRRLGTTGDRGTIGGMIGGRQGDGVEFAVYG